MTVSVSEAFLGMRTSLLIAVLLLSHRAHGKQGPVLQCVVNQEQCMTCMWNQHGTPSENYSLYYWYSDSVPPSACHRYLQDSDTNIGCWLNASEVRSFSPFTARLNNSDNERTTTSRNLNLHDLVKLDPPCNLRVKNTSRSELLLSWDPAGDFPRKDCLRFQVQHRNMDSDTWTVREVSSTQFSLPSFDPQQIYLFHVRSQLNKYCANAQMWSEWSAGVTWGSNITQSVGHSQTSLVTSLVISLTSSFLLLMLLVLLVRMERVWVIFVPRIPNPGKNFEDLFSTHRGDFQEWLGVSKDAAESLKQNYTEALCSVTEDPECPGADVRPPPTPCPSICPANQSLLD